MRFRAIAFLAILPATAIFGQQPEIEGSIIFELNATDDDAEVVLRVKADRALRAVIVIDPRNDDRVFVAVMGAWQ